MVFGWFWWFLIGRRSECLPRIFLGFLCFHFLFGFFKVLLGFGNLV